jgi:hypothetical protein
MGDVSRYFLQRCGAPADEQYVMSRIVTWPAPSLRQRAAIMLVGNLLALLSMIACTAGPTAPSAGSAPPQRTARAPIMAGAPVASPPAIATAAAVLPALREAAAAVPIAIVANTSGYGVWMRREPGGEPLKVWPDGAPMTIIGERESVDGRAWQNVRAADGQSGWVAAEYLVDSDGAAVIDAVTLAPSSTEAPNVPAAPPPTAAPPPPPPPPDGDTPAAHRDDGPAGERRRSREAGRRP